MKSVMVFKTSVSSDAEVERLKPLLNGLLHNGEHWNFDLEDWENILRIESAHCGTMPVIGLLKSLGHYCEELDH